MYICVQENVQSEVKLVYAFLFYLIWIKNSTGFIYSDV